MKINARCAECLLEKQMAKTSDEEYLAEVRSLLDGRTDWDCSPYMVYRFNEAYVRRFGKGEDYGPVKRQYNELVLGMEPALRARLDGEADPLAAAFALARLGNYIDFAALKDVNERTFLSLFDDLSLTERDRPAYESFISACRSGRRFLLICDNCGEIGLDKLFLERLAAAFPQLELAAMVRGGEVLNDATLEDARAVGLDRVARLVTNGMPIGGTIYELLPEDARAALDGADVVLAKGQANYESLSGQGRHIFYAFLCKCELFTGRFGVPPLTGMLVEEGGEGRDVSEVRL